MEADKANSSNSPGKAPGRPTGAARPRPTISTDETHANAMIRDEDGTIRLVASGSWNLRNASALGQQVDQDILRPAGRRSRDRSAQPSDNRSAQIDLSLVEHLDTAGVLILNRVAKNWRSSGYQVEMVGATSEQSVLIDEVMSHGDLTEPPIPRLNSILRLFADAGRTVTGVWQDLVTVTGFLGALTATIGGVLVRPWRFRGVSFVHHLEHAGLRAVPIIALICALIGAVVMQQGAVQLRPYGAEPYAVNMLAVLSLREVGVLLTAIMVAGRSGSAFTAEIGSMKMREEIDAMRTLGLDPLEVLVLPRVLALIVALPLLTFVGDIMCLFGGGIIAVFYLGLEPLAYVERLQEAASLRHFMVGMVKTPFAALIIGLIGCIEGLKVAGSAESLGQHVTSAVVKAIFLVIILDAFFAMFLSGIGY